MTEHIDDPTGPVLDKTPAEPTPGEILRKLREEKGLTHAAVGQALHLTGHYIRALEADDYSKLPALTFVKGYLKSYARFMDADVDTVLARYDNHIEVMLDAGKQTERVQRSRRRHDQALRWAIGAGFVVVAGLVAGWWFLSGDDTPANAAQTSAPAAQTGIAARPQGNSPAANPAATRSSTTVAGTFTPAPAANSGTAVTAKPITEAVATTTTDDVGQEISQEINQEQETQTAEATGVNEENNEENNQENSGVTITPEANGARQVALVSAGEDELRVVFNGNSWIEVDDGRSVRLYNDMLRAGDTLTIRGAAPFHVLLGDATQVAISVNATAIDISGEIRDDSTARLVFGDVAGSVASEEAPL